MTSWNNLELHEAEITPIPRIADPDITPDDIEKWSGVLERFIGMFERISIAAIPLIGKKSNPGGEAGIAPNVYLPNAPQQAGKATLSIDVDGVLNMILPLLEDHRDKTVGELLDALPAFRPQLVARLSTDLLQFIGQE